MSYFAPLTGWGYDLRMLKNTTVQAWLALIMVIFAAATAPIFIRYAQAEGVPSLSIITLRLFMGTLVLTPIVWRRYRADLKRLGGGDWWLAGGAGFFHALGLLCLFFALEYTSVLVNSVLRRTSPLWTIGLEIVVLHVVFSRQVWLGVLLTLVGSGVVVLGGVEAVSAGTRPLLGAGLSLLNAVTISFYLIIGRKLRTKLPFLAYTWILFASATLVSWVFTVVTNTPLSGFSQLGYVWIVVVTIVAQLMGHLPINFTLRHFPATYLSAMLQISVVASAVIAVFALSEIPSIWQIGGSLLIIVGVLIVILQKKPLVASR